MQLSKTSSPPMRLSKARCHTPSSSPVLKCLGIRTTPQASGITPMANSLPMRLMAPRSSLQVRAGGTQRKTLLRAAVTIPSRAPLERSKHRDHGELPTSDRSSNSVVGGGWDGTLVAWCLMPQVLKKHPHLVNPDGHVSDGISLTGGKFNYRNFREGEMSGPPYQGVMFYSTDPASGGYVLTPKGTTVPRGAPDEDHD